MAYIFGLGESSSMWTFVLQTLFGYEFTILVQ